MPSRRDFLAAVAAAAATSALPAAATSILPTPALRTRTIPATGEGVPVIGMGTSGSFEVDAAGRAPLHEVLRRFVAGGGRVIDTSPNYSNAEDVLGDLLAAEGLRDAVFLATKLAADDRASGEAQFAASLRRLRTDRVELLAVHNLRDWRTQLALARELKAQGLTKYVGLTHYQDARHDELAALVESEKPDWVQINYSVAAPGAARRLLPAAQANGVAVMINRAFDDGRLFARVGTSPLPAWAAEAGATSWAQLFLRFALAHPAVTTVIPATGKPDRQTDNLRAGSGADLSPAQQAELIAMFA